MTRRFPRTARLLIAFLAVYGFVLQGFGRDAAAVAKAAPQLMALCLPGDEAQGQPRDHDAGSACALHCTGSTPGVALPAPAPAGQSQQRVTAAALPTLAPQGVSLRRLTLPEARGPPRRI